MPSAAFTDATDAAVCAAPQTVQYQELHTGNVVKRMVDAWPWISVTGSLVIGGEALLLLLLLHRCKKREEED